MTDAASRVMQRVGSDPSLLGRGVQWLDTGFTLGPGLEVDALLRDGEGRVLFATGADDPDADLATVVGRVVLLHGAIRAGSGLLTSLLATRRLTLEGARIVLVVPRAPDPLLRLSALLDEPGLQVLSLGDAARAAPETAQRVPVPAPATPPEPPPEPVAAPVAETAEVGRPEEPEATTGAAPAASPEPLVVTVPRAPAGLPRRVPPVTPAATPGAGRGLLDEARRRILRVSEDVVAERDGAMTRYRYHDRLLAVLEEESEQVFHLHVGHPLRRRTIGDARDLASALDEILRHFLSGEEGPGERRVS